jgi:hypothetical protein
LSPPDTPVSFTNKTYLYDIAVTEILLKIAFNNIITPNFLEMFNSQEETTEMSQVT